MRSSPPSTVSTNAGRSCGNHPDWSFYGKDFPPKAELLAARNRVIERHPKTKFVGLHVANHPENLDDVSAWLEEVSQPAR